MNEESSENLIAPRWHEESAYPSELYSEILSGLYMGGTADDDTVDFAVYAPGLDYCAPFDAAVTLYAWANPFSWGVEELRYGFGDGNMYDVDINRVLRIAKWALDRWSEGERVLIRCQAGLNRSGLITALTLMMAGYEADEAIDMIRERRSQHALFNNHFVSWLREEAPAHIERLSSRSAA